MTGNWHTLLEPLRPIDVPFRGFVDNASHLWVQITANTVNYHNRRNHILWRVTSPICQ